MYKIIHFRKECIGCGLCVTHAPDFWQMNDDDNKVDLKNSKEENGNFILEISEEAMEQNKFAAEACPINIIHIYNDKGEDINN